jgi:hypothetical protein
VWDGEPRSSSSSEVESEPRPKKPGSRFRRHLPGARSPKSAKDSLGPETDTFPSLSVAGNEDLGVPDPWISASTTNRAEPRVLHGYTLTKEVSFREVCLAIKAAAFVTRYVGMRLECGSC